MSIHQDDVIELLIKDGYPPPQVRKGSVKCPYCTLVTDDIDTMADHIRHDCDLAYND